MYLRTPKRYLKPRRHVLSMRWVWLWLLTPLVALAGYLVYERRAEFAPSVETALDGMVDTARAGMATAVAPTPLPTENPASRLAQAEGAWRQGAIDDALALYNEVRENAPNNLEVYYRSTVGLVMNGRYPEAVEMAEQTITANPFASDAWAARSYALNYAGRQGEAIASALQALQIDPDSARAQAFLAEAYFDSNQIERARTTVEAVLDDNPDSFEALYVWGRINEESLFDFETAMDAYRQAYDLAPNMHYIGVSLAWMYLTYEQNADAGFELLTQIADQSPNNAEALYALSFFSYSAYGDPNQALDYLTRCTSAAPTNTRCWWYLGTVQFNLGDDQAAQESFMRVIDLGTTTPRHYLSAGRINAALNNCAAAVPLLREGYQLEEATGAADVDQLNAFEEALLGCGATVTGTAAGGAVQTGDPLASEATAEAAGEAQ